MSLQVDKNLYECVCMDWNDIATFHDIVKKWEELEKSGASVCDL